MAIVSRGFEAAGEFSKYYYPSIKKVRELPPLRSSADAAQGSEINCGRIFWKSSKTNEIIDSLLTNSELETLVIDGDWRSDKISLESCRALGGLVRTSTTLKNLSLRLTGIRPEGLKLIVEGILDNPQSTLEALDLGHNMQLGRSHGNNIAVGADEVGEGMEQSRDGVDSLQGCWALGKLLQTNKTLQYLNLYDVNLGQQDLKDIVEGALGNPQSSLESLDLGCNRRLRCPRSQGADVDKGADEIGEGAEQSRDVVHPWEGWRALGQLLGMSTVLKRLHLSCVGMRGEHLKYIVEGILENSRSVLETLDLPRNRNFGSQAWKDETRVGDGAKQVRDLLLGNRARALATLNLGVLDLTEAEVRIIAEALASNTTVINLCVENWRTTDLKVLFDSLKRNKTLQKLILEAPEDESPASEDLRLLELFRVNFAIKHVYGLGRCIEEKHLGMVEEMLFRNKQFGDYITTLQEKFKFAKPSIGRLFMCGSPYAGKTSLRKSMVGTQAGWGRKAVIKAHSVLQGAHVLTHPNERTQGIEVQSLKARTGERIAIWDLAGQEDYRALHDNHYLFPEMSQPCLFLFVFRPEDSEGNCNIDQHSLLRLTQQLHYWLSFINSNSRQGQMITPRLLIVLTHLDVLTKTSNVNADSYVSWAWQTVQDMKESFSGQVEIQDTIHAVNSHSQKDAIRVIDGVMKIVGDVFPQLADVPAACEQVNLMLTKWIGHHKSEPILCSDRFFELCAKKVPELKEILQISPSTIPEALVDSAEKLMQYRQALVSYLHGSGSIINFQESKHVVVNINWLGQTFLGQLFDRHNEAMRKELPSTKDGIVPENQLKRFLNKFICERKYAAGISADILIELMKVLKVLLEEIDRSTSPVATTTRKYIMPCTLDDTPVKGRLLNWTNMRHDFDCEPIYTGFRLHCRDQDHTFLSPGFFLRYQVHLLEKLSDAKRQGSVQQFDIKRDLIHVVHRNVEMFVESSGKLEDPEYRKEEAYVDILMRSFDKSRSDRQHKYLYGVLELQKFCASSEGCPGVSLEESILRPDCVENLTPCPHRRNQAVLREKVKNEMLRHVLANMASSSESFNGKVYPANITGDSSNSKMYRHYFEAVPDIGLEGAMLSAATLLDDWTDVQDIVGEHQQLAISRVSDILEVQKDIEIAVLAQKTSSHQSGEGETPPACSGNHHDYDRPATLREIEVLLKENSKEILNGIESMIVPKLEEAVKGIQWLRGQQISMMQKLEESAVFQQGQPEIMPKFPYFTRHDVGLRRKVLALKNYGHALTLHFMCEEPRGQHFVKSQEGLPISFQIQGKHANTIRLLISASVDIFLIILKVAAHVGAGIGNAIPNFTQWEGALPLNTTTLMAETFLNEIKMMESSSAVNPDSKKVAWQCLLDEIVGPVLKRTEIPKKFGLYQVHYRSNHLNKKSQFSCFWVCRECREKAERAHELVDDGTQIEPMGFLKKTDVRYP